MQRFLAVRIAIAPEGFERNSDQIRSSILVLKGTRCKKNAGNPATSSRTSDAVPRLATRRAGRTAARFGSPLTARTARHPVCGEPFLPPNFRRRVAGVPPVRREALLRVAVSVSVGPT